MGDTLLATAGDSIKLWDASTHTFYQEIPFENGEAQHKAAPTPLDIVADTCVVFSVVT